MKTGEVINMHGQTYLFLGYSDYRKKWGVFADKYGNTHVKYIG